MTRPMMPAPPDTIVVKTSRDTWVALLERWGEDGALHELEPLRPSPGAPIMQEGERRDMLRRLLDWLLRHSEQSTEQSTEQSGG